MLDIKHRAQIKNHLPSANIEMALSSDFSQSTSVLTRSPVKASRTERRPSFVKLIKSSFGTFGDFELSTGEITPRGAHSSNDMTGELVSGEKSVQNMADRLLASSVAT
jgi:hypothetical protein